MSADDTPMFGGTPHHGKRQALQQALREGPPSYQTVVHDEVARWGVRHQRWGNVVPDHLVELTAKWVLEAGA